MTQMTNMEQRLVDMINRLPDATEADNFDAAMFGASDLFNEAGCLIAEAKGEIPTGLDATVEINGDPTNRCTVGELFRADDGIDPSERGQIVAALRDHGEYRGGGGASAEYVLRTIPPTA